MYRITKKYCLQNKKYCASFTSFIDYSGRVYRSMDERKRRKRWRQNTENCEGATAQKCYLIDIWERKFFGILLKNRKFGRRHVIILCVYLYSNVVFCLCTFIIECICSSSNSYQHLIEHWSVAKFWIRYLGTVITYAPYLFCFWILLNLIESIRNI